MKSEKRHFSRLIPSAGAIHIPKPKLNFNIFYYDNNRTYKTY